MYSQLKTKKERVAFIKEKLGTDKRWALRALVRIMENQTKDEQEMEVTAHHNGVGFTAYDAKFLTSLAQQYKDYGYLSAKQMEALHKAIPKYASQLERMTQTD